MKLKKQLLSFYKLFKKKKTLKINFFLLLIILLLTPVQNYYAKLEIKPGSPVIREIDFSLPPPADYPVKVKDGLPPFLTATSVYVIDVGSRSIILARNQDAQLYPASTTKIMTALVAIDHYKPDQLIEVKEEYKVGMVMGLEAGEQITVENLLYGLLVGSANDAAYLLAVNFKGGLEEFIKAMNEKAKQYRLDKTFFKNPTGVEEEGHITSAHDLAVLTVEAINNPVFKKIVAIKKITIPSINFKKEYNLANVNELLGVVPGLRGIKTGWTANAGECLVSWVERDQRGIITVILKSSDRFGESKRLIEWVFQNYRWEPIAANQE